ncbi:hypothetical protein Pgin03_01386 [Porphyromonas gingivalis]
MILVLAVVAKSSNSATGVTCKKIYERITDYGIE